MQLSILQQRFEQLRSNKLFELSVIAIILFSALMVGAKTFNLHVSVQRVIYFLDWAITLFFLVEVLIRFLGEPNKKRFFYSAWNIFDTLIVIISLIPIEDSELALVGRLIRIFRVLRMISILPELRVLMSSLAKALPQMGYVCLLLFIIFYIYAAIGATFFSSINPTLWGDIRLALLTLFRVMTFEDWTDVMYETMTVYSYSWIFYITFIFFTAFAFLNMMIGIIVKVLDEAQEEQNEQIREEMGLEDQTVEQQLLAINQKLTELQKSIDAKSIHSSH